jgi:PST family polysaccharide transporter
MATPPIADDAELPDATRAQSGQIAERLSHTARWILVRRVSAILSRLTVVAILARQLDPATFGIVALAQTLVQVLTVLDEAGVGTYVIYDHSDDPRGVARAAWWLNQCITAVQVGVVLALIPFASTFYDRPSLGPVLAALAVAYFGSQMAVVPEALLRRALRHDLVIKRDLVIDAAAAASSIALALAGFGVWSLVWPAVVSGPARFAIALVAARWVPGWKPQLGKWRTILRYTKHLIGVEVIALISNNGDNLLVGKLFGSASLAFYNMAWQLSNLVGQNITSVVGSLSFPAIAGLDRNLRRMRDSYLRMLALLTLVCSPALLGLLVVAPEAVRLVYGERWSPVVPLLQIFIIYTLLRSLTSHASAVWNALGRPDLGLKLSAAFLPITLTAMAVGSRGGPKGVAVGVVAVRVVGALVTHALAARQINLGITEAARAIRAPLALATLVGVSAAAAKALAAPHFGPLGRLSLASAVGASVFLTGLRVGVTGSRDLRFIATRMVPGRISARVFTALIRVRGSV